MARPQKQTVDYFPHFILRSMYGNDGYAFWYQLLELLAQTEGHFFDCNNPADWMFLLAETNVSEGVANQILKSLADLEAVDRDLWEEKVIWCQKFVDMLEVVYKRRRVPKPEKPGLCNQKPGKCEQKPHSKEMGAAETIQSKVKQSKVKNASSSNEEEAGTPAPPEKKPSGKTGHFSEHIDDENILESIVNEAN